MPSKEYHLPVIPFSPIDALNRRAAAVGSVGYAQAASQANYNGHHLHVWWNSCRKYYITEYFWAGRIVLARGDFASCLREALAYYDRGALGSSVQIEPREDDEAAIALCDSTARVVPGPMPKNHWWTWRHELAVQAARDSAIPAPVLIFDWALMQEAADEATYLELVKAKHGRLHT